MMFSPNVVLLLDIDECSTGDHNCSQRQKCINRIGDYICVCASGYELLNDVCEGKIFCKLNDSYVA